jgi:hypothetical protein
MSLDDEFASFDVREELERQLEQRLREVDIDARPALKPFEPTADNDGYSRSQDDRHHDRTGAATEQGPTIFGFRCALPHQCPEFTNPIAIHPQRYSVQRPGAGQHPA